jgi:hypothetical protein
MGLDSEQIIKHSYDATNEAIQVNVVESIDPSGNLSVISSHVVDFSSIPNSATAPFEITASLASECKKIVIQEQTGEVLQLRIGASTGTLLFYVAAGQDNPMDVVIAAGTRVTVRSNGSAPGAGVFVVSFLG